MSATEVGEWVNQITVEKAYQRGMQAIHDRNQAFAERGMRAARARDARLLLVLEQGTEIIDRMAEGQMGRTRRDKHSTVAEKTEMLEVQLWRKAYEFADKGEPLEQFRWIYGMAASLAFA